MCYILLLKTWSWLTNPTYGDLRYWPYCFGWWLMIGRFFFFKFINGQLWGVLSMCMWLLFFILVLEVLNLVSSRKQPSTIIVYTIGFLYFLLYFKQNLNINVHQIQYQLTFIYWHDLWGDHMIIEVNFFFFPLFTPAT